MRRLSTRRKTLLVAASAALLFAAAGVGGFTRGAAARQSARSAREFKIRAGRSVTFGGEDLRLRFVSVESDSRCPAKVNCVWAGNAEVLVEVGARGGGGKRTLGLNTNAGPERPAEGRYGRYTVKLVGLSPYPSATRKIKPGEYTATLLVVRD